MLDDGMKEYLTYTIKQLIEFGLCWTSSCNYIYSFERIAEESRLDKKWLKDNYSEVIDIFNSFDEIIELETNQDGDIDVIFSCEEVCKRCPDYSKRCLEKCQKCDTWCDYMANVSQDEGTIKESKDELSEYPTALDKVEHVIDLCLDSLRKADNVKYSDIEPVHSMSLGYLKHNLAKTLNDIVDEQKRIDKLSVVCTQIAELSKDIDPYEFMDQAEGNSSHEAVLNLSKSILKDTLDGKCGVYFNNLREWSKDTDIDKSLSKRAESLYLYYRSLI